MSISVYTHIHASACFHVFNVVYFSMCISMLVCVSIPMVEMSGIERPQEEHRDGLLVG